MPVNHNVTQSHKQAQFFVEEDEDNGDDDDDDDEYVDE
jgi:hypothetical protein